MTGISPLDVKEREEYFAEQRWAFCQGLVEPHLIQASGDNPYATELLPNHEFLIRSSSRAMIIVKCRKTAHSWGISLKGLSRAATQPKSTTIIGSYDEEEANEKLIFLDWQYDVLPESVKRELGMKGSHTRTFNNGARIKVISRKAPTGAGAAIEWDEFSVERKGSVTASEIMTAAIGCTTHTGSISLGGTQRGPETMFNKLVIGEGEAAADADPLFAALADRAWNVGHFPWWASPALCKDVAGAMGGAPVGSKGTRGAWAMATEDRVAKYGNEALLYQYRLYKYTPTLGEDLFKREFELLVLDDRESYYPLELLQSGYALAGPNYWFKSVEIKEGGNYNRGSDILAQAKLAVDALAKMIQIGEFRGDFGLAMDIGRDHDRDEIWVGHNAPNDRESLLPRLNIGMDDMPFGGKEEIIDYIFSKIAITRANVDATRGGLAVQFAERMIARYGARVIAFQFTNSSKQIIASGVKAMLQMSKLALPPKSNKFEKLENQMLKIKKLITPSGNVLFDIERNKKQGHGDAFWALAMLCELYTMPAIWTPRRGAVLQQTRNSPFGN